MVRAIAFLLSCTVLAATADAAVKSKSVTYKHGETDCVGFLAYDDSIEGPRPGVAVFHEFWGLDAYTKRRVEQLASLGYIAFAADMYGKGKLAEHPNDARAMMSEVRANVAEWKNRAHNAIDVLKSQPQCDKTTIAAIGYCFGGSTVQQLAFSGTDLKAVVSFHGGLVIPSPEQVKQIKCAMLICNGADDTFISADSIKKFREVMDANGAKYQFINYPGAVHSFTVPEADESGKKFSIPIKYNKAADEKSWSDMRALFKDTLGK
jgi:dienelactone hydrolase